MTTTYDYIPAGAVKNRIVSVSFALTEQAFADYKSCMAGKDVSMKSGLRGAKIGWVSSELKVKDRMVGEYSVYWMAYPPHFRPCFPLT